MERISSQSLDRTEDLAIKFLSEDEVLQLLLREDLKQSLMVAPLWKYFALKSNALKLPD